MTIEPRFVSILVRILLHYKPADCAVFFFFFSSYSSSSSSSSSSYSSSSSVWDRRLSTECTAAYLGWLYEPHFSFHLSSPGALHVRWHDGPLSAKGGTMGEKCPINLSYNCDFRGNCRVLLHTANLPYGTDGFTSPPKEGVLRVFSPLKVRRLRPGLNPRTWVPESTEAA
jgi:hypothetical protein